MKLKLINHTPNPDLTVYQAARCCYMAGDVTKTPRAESEQVQKFIDNLVTSGHESPLEHCSFTFAVSGVSRVVTHELVRHRIASYSQQSQRYVNYSEKDIEGDMYIPLDIRESPAASETYKYALHRCVTAYNKLIELGIKPQDARYILPNAAPAQIVYTMNARTLLNFFKLRCCRRAQPEMIELASLMLMAVKKVAPAIFKKAGPPCWRLEPCGEVHKPDECKKMYHETEDK